MSAHGAPKSAGFALHFATGHEDLVHDVAYDFYGRRMATVSSDQTLNIFNKTGDDGEWVLSSSFRAHDATITKVIWAPPEHGQILATCSLDRTVKIFEEQEMEPLNSPQRWKRQYQMTPETRSAIHSIAFPPTPSGGLKLAFISGDGVVQIYECREPQDLTHWISVDVLQILTSPPSRESEVSFCIDFCPSRPGGEMLVVGAMNTATVWRADKNGKFRAAEVLAGHNGLVRDVAWATSMGRSHHLIATACKDGHVRIFKLSHSKMEYVIKPQARGHGPGEGRRRLGAGLSEALGGSGEVNDGDKAGDDETERWEVQKIADFDDHGCDVWKVAWNVTGTILSSVGDDGKIRLWQTAMTGEYKLMSVVNTPKSRDVLLGGR